MIGATLGNGTCKHHKWIWMQRLAYDWRWLIIHLFSLFETLILNKLLQAVRICDTQRRACSSNKKVQVLFCIPIQLESRKELWVITTQWNRSIIMLRLTQHTDPFLFFHTLAPLWLISLMLITHSSHTYSTSFPHLLHYDSCLSCSWLIVHTLTPLPSHTCSTMTHSPYLYFYYIYG